MRRWLTITLGGLVLSCQGPAAVLAREHRVAELRILIEGGWLEPVQVDDCRR